MRARGKRCRNCTTDGMHGEPSDSLVKSRCTVIVPDRGCGHTEDASVTKL
jgi:hypothetical protein